MADAADVTADALLGGRVRLSQPAAGYRAAIDPVLLAATVPAAARGRALDLGCGAGAVMLCAATRAPGLAVVGLERDAALAALARANVAANGLAARASVVDGDVARPPCELGAGDFDFALANPPFLDPATADPPPDPGRAAAHVEDTPLAAWIAAARRALRPGGSLAVIHRADRLADLLGALDGFGDAVVVPLWPREGQAARRVIVAARKGRRGPLALAAGLALHGADGRFTPAAEAILRDGGALALAGRGT